MLVLGPETEDCGRLDTHTVVKHVILLVSVYLDLCYLCTASLKRIISTSCLKKNCAKLFLSELRQIPTNFEIFEICLCQSFVLPILTYGREGIGLSGDNINRLNVCWNDIYRTVLGFHRWVGIGQICSVTL